MSNICDNCFSDEEMELKAFIGSQGIIGKCDFCKSDINKIIPTEELLDFFNELLSNFQLDPKGQSLVSLIQGDWDLFKSNSIGIKFLNIIMGDLNIDFHNAEVTVNYSNDILDNINYWSTLKEKIKWERRYLIDVNYLTDELGWDGFFQSKIIINKDDILYRARRHEETDKEAYSSENMFCPPRTNSTAGRANPMGIPYLYLSDKKETILYEIRSAYLDEVSIGSFKVSNNREKEVKISDFTENSTIYHPNEVNERIKSRLLKRLISIDLSKPMRRYDSDLDYIPTQFICEFIKVFTGVDGLKFTSSLHSSGNNFVIFDQSIMQCIEVDKVKISKVKISFN